MSVRGKELRNSIAGMSLYNSNGAVDPGSTGFKYAIDTLTYIRSRITEQRFYEISIADYLPLDVGEAAWSDEIVQNQSFTQGGSFFDGDIDTLSGNGRIATVDTALAPKRMPVKTWAKQAGWTIPEIEKAARSGNWDVVSSKLEGLKKNWDLGIQRTAFLGHPSTPDLTGLVNNDDVNVDTTTITGPINGLSDSDFQAFVGSLLQEFYDNSGSTTLPDTFLMPTDDYLGLGRAASANNPHISRLQYMLDAFRAMTANEQFAIMPLTYLQPDHSFGQLTNPRYVLYKNEQDTLSMSIPVDFTMLQADTSNQLLWSQPAYGQYSGVLIMRVPEVLYFDDTSE